MDNNDDNNVEARDANHRSVTNTISVLFKSKSGVEKTGKQNHYFILLLKRVKEI